MRCYNILVCGVGGTGVMEFGTLLKEVAIIEGMSVVGLERRGATQRGGGASSTARLVITEENEAYDERRVALTGAISFGQADLIIATEAIAALRHLPYISKHSQVVLNNRTVKLVGSEYPDIEDIAGEIRKVTKDVYSLDASELSMQSFGTYRWTNPILLGVALARTTLPIKKETSETLLRREDEKKALVLGLAHNFD